nr:hypothetical protein [Tanacetum cinerariifolium]
ESHKERPAVAKSTDFINIDDKEEELAGDALERKKRKGIVEIKDTPPPILIRSPRTHTTPLSSNKEKLQELTISDPTPSSSKSTTSSPKLKQYQVKQYKSMFYKISRQYGYMFRHLKQSFMPRKDFSDINKGVHATLKEVVPKMVDQNTNDFMKNNLPRTSEFGTNTTSESSSYQVMDESNPSGSGTQEELEDFDAWLNKQGIDDDEVSDDEVSTEEVSPELFAEVSERKMTIDDIQRMQNAVNIMMRDQFGIVYENSKKEKKVMMIKDILKFCDATLKRVLEKVKKFNLDVKHEYDDPKLSDANAEYMEFYKEYIQDHLKHVIK